VNVKSAALLSPELDASNTSDMTARRRSNAGNRNSPAVTVETWKQMGYETGRSDVYLLRANLHFTLWMCIADDSSKVKGVKTVFIRISSKMNIQSDQ
jgi:hypothetical protein